MSKHHVTATINGEPAEFLCETENTLLDALRDQLRQTSDRLRQAAERIAQLEAARREAPAPTPAPAPAAAPIAAAAVAAKPAESAAEVEELQKTLQMAQRFVEQTKREAEAEAAALIAAAEAKATQLQTEAQTRLRDEVGRLEGVKSQLTGEVASLANQLDTERVRLRRELQEVLRWIDEHVQPSAAIRALGTDQPTEAVQATSATEAEVLQLRHDDDLG